MTKFAVSTAITFAVAIIGGAVWVGMLEGRVRGLEGGTTVEEAKNRAIAEVDSRLSGAAVPAGAAMFFKDGECPESWRQMDRVEGRFLMAAGGRFGHGTTGGGTIVLKLENTPPHRHKVKHFSMAQGESNSITGWGSSKGSNATSGPVSRGKPELGEEDVHRVAEPFDVIPRYLALTLCVKN